MGQIIKVQWPVSSVSISDLYVILEAKFTIALRFAKKNINNLIKKASISELA
jgi:hypothetical protein